MIQHYRLYMLRAQTDIENRILANHNKRRELEDALYDAEQEQVDLEDLLTDLMTVTYEEWVTKIEMERDVDVDVECD